jgi:hypothetical protein
VESGKPPEFCTGSRNTAATVSTPSKRIAYLDPVSGPAAEVLEVVGELRVAGVGMEGREANTSNSSASRRSTR